MISKEEGFTSHVEFGIETTPQVVVNAINQDVKNVCCQHSICPYNREVGLSLPAEPHRSLALVAAYPLRKCGVFDDYLQDEEIHMGIERGSCRTMGMLEEVGCKRKVSAERSNVRLARCREVDQIEAEQFVGVRKIVG